MQPKDGLGSAGAELDCVTQLLAGWKNPVRFYLVTVHVLFCAAQTETFEEEREKKSNEKNFLKEVE